MSQTSKISMSRLVATFIAILLTGVATRLGDDVPRYIYIIPVVMLWLSVLLRFALALAQPIVKLRRWIPIFWLVELTACVAIIMVWLVAFQPAAGIAVSDTEWFWLIGCFYGLIALSTVGAKQPTEEKQVSHPSWWTGPMITLTTLVIIVIGIELGLRYVWVMSDNFQFSAMHRNWSRLYWNPLNDVGEGYRDYSPAPNDERTHVLIAGDSLVAGYGVNDIDNTFPHLLGDMLGEDFTVNIVAQPGWGIGTAFGALQSYPTQPDIVVLSHYVNDIAEGSAGQQYHQPFPTIRLEPSENQRWWVENFHITNFLYYRVFLYTQHDSVGLYNSWLRGAYENPDVWNAYQSEMQTWIDWSAANDVELIVIVWSNLLAIDGWRDMTEPVVTYFEQQGIPVVDMSDYLEGENPAKLTVNLFDAHPSEYSHQIAAENLYHVIAGNEE
jgi:hypothetical protein